MTPMPPDRRAVAVAGHTGDVGTARAGMTAADASVRATALTALDRLGQLADDELVVAFADHDAVVRRRAATLGATRPAVDLAPLLADPDPTVAEAAAWAAGEQPAVTDDVIAALVELASGVGSGRDALVREAAVAALGARGNDRGLPAVLAATEDRPPIRRRAVLALAPFLDPDHPQAAAVAAALARAAEDRDWQVRQAAEDIAP